MRALLRRASGNGEAGNPSRRIAAGSSPSGTRRAAANRASASRSPGFGAGPSRRVLNSRICRFGSAFS